MGTYEWKPFTLLVSAEEVEKEVLKIEAGKYYKTRDGRKVGPVREQNGYLTTNGWHYAENGECCYKGISGNEKQPEFDLISDWQEGPIRTVTRREILPGVYGRLYIAKQVADTPRILVKLADQQGNTCQNTIAHGWSLEELDEAIHTLTQIREVIAEENGK